MKNMINHLNRDQLYTLKTLKTPSAGKTFAKWLMALFLVFILCMFLPWQQNIRGTGKLSAFSPENRPQAVETTIAGRISKWYVTEGQFISAGDTILTLSEVKDKYFDPNLLARLKEQMEAKESSIDAKNAKAKSLQNQIAALSNALQAKTTQAKNKLTQAKLKLVSDSVDFEAEKVRFANLENQFERNKTLYEAGNIALTKFQELESKYQEARMKVVSAENKWLESKASLANAEVEIAGVQAEYQDKISKAESDLNTTLSGLYEAEAALSKMKNEYANMQIRNDQYQIVAPQDGYLVRTIQAGIGETIKEGEPVASIVPESPDKAVELYINAMDVPLIAEGRDVRLEFDGWPALQFSGWPSVSVGTFGGEVKVIDRLNSQGNKYRLLVVPDEEDEDWPEQLRLGSGVKGWVMLDNVPLWYELWRQLNGFPPSLYEPVSEEGQSQKEPSK